MENNITYQNIRRGDILICTRTYIESEFDSYRRYTQDSDRLIHITRGRKYKIESFSSNQIQVTNDLNHLFWYDYERFDTIRNWRKRKLIKLNNIKNENIHLSIT